MKGARKLAAATLRGTKMTAEYPGVAPIAMVQVLGVPERTVRRWAASGRMPREWAVLWALKYDADLGALDRAWAGFKIRDGIITTPEGYPVKPGDLRAMPLTEQLLSEYRKLATRPAQLLLGV